VKPSATVNPADFVGLRTLAEGCENRLAYGPVLYDSGAVLGAQYQLSPKGSAPRSFCT
jgi:hypothetical protein